MRASFAAFKELTARFPDSQYYEDSIMRMKYLNNALGDVRGQGRALLLQPRRLHRGGQSRAGAISSTIRRRRPTRMRSTCWREATTSWGCRSSPTTRGRSSPRRSPTASTSKGVARQAVVAVLVAAGHDLRRAGHRRARDQAVVEVLVIQRLRDSRAPVIPRCSSPPQSPQEMRLRRLRRACAASAAAPARSAGRRACRPAAGRRSSARRDRSRCGSAARRPA